MAQEVYMNIPVVERMVGTFNTCGETLKRISQVLEGLMMILKATAFVGFVGGAIVERWLSVLKPQVDKMAAKMLELSRDVNDAIKSYRDGDQTGSNHFR
jgi:hypothetical protein